MVAEDTNFIRLRKGNGHMLAAGGNSDAAGGFGQVPLARNFETRPVDSEELFTICIERPEGGGVCIEPDGIRGDKRLQLFSDGKLTELEFFQDAVVADGDEKVLVGNID